MKFKNISKITGPNSVKNFLQKYGIKCLRRSGNWSKKQKSELEWKLKTENNQKIKSKPRSSSN